MVFFHAQIFAAWHSENRWFYRREYLLNKSYKARLINKFVTLKRDILHALIEYKKDLNKKELW